MLTRILISLRWPMATLALIALVALFASRVLVVCCKVPLGASTPAVGLEIDCGSLNIYRSAWGPAPEPELTVAYLADKPYVMRSTWDIVKSGPMNWRMPTRVPLWAIAAPAAGIALVGYWLKHRKLAPGQCRNCGYPMKSGSTCPECGAVHAQTPASAVGGNAT